MSLIYLILFSPQVYMLRSHGLLKYEKGHHILILTMAAFYWNHNGWIYLEQREKREKLTEITAESYTGGGASAAGRWIWFRYELLNELFSFIVSAFADVLVADIALFIDQVSCGPESLLESAPGGAVIIQGDGVGDPQLFRCLQNVVVIFFVAELRVVHADDHKVIPFILLVP